MDSFLTDVQQAFPWTDNLDDLLTHWDNLQQAKTESVISLVHRLEALKLRRQLEHNDVSALAQFNRFKRALKPALQEALLSHFGPSKFRCTTNTEASQQLQEAITYLTTLEAIRKTGHTQPASSTKDSPRNPPPPRTSKPSRPVKNRSNTP